MFFDDDDDLLAASFDESSEAPLRRPENVHFNCLGEDSSTKTTFHLNSFLRNYHKDYPEYCDSDLDQIDDINIFDIKLHEDSFCNVDMLKVLFNKARMNIQTLIMLSRENSTIIPIKTNYQLRIDVTKFLYYLKEMIVQDRIDIDMILSNLKSMRLILGSIETLPIVKILHNIYSNEGNDCQTPAYHLLHGNLEWRWLYLLVSLEIVKTKSNVNDFNHMVSLRETEFEEQLQLLIYDLTVISICKFNKYKIGDLLYRSPFTCCCVKELWLLVQVLIEQLNENDQINTFWFYFNKTVNAVRDGQSGYNINSFQNIVCKLVNIMLPDNWLQFSLWLLNGVIKLQTYTNRGISNGPTNDRVKENFEFLDNLTKIFLTSEPSEEHTRFFLLIILPIVTEWWPVKTDIIMCFWEYFHKKLNSSFFLPGSSLSSLGVISNTAVGYLEQVKTQLNTTSINPNHTSFSIFVHLLGKLLNRFSQTDQKNQIQKILGRIYSKFTATKLLALNETGIHNIITLFLTLALNTDLKEIGDRIQNFLFQIPLAKISQPRQICITKGHVCLIFLYVNQKLDIRNYVIKLIEQLQMVQLDEGYQSVLRILAECTVDVLGKSDNFNLGEHYFLDTWIIKYLQSCSSNEQEKLLKCINGCLLKITSILNAIISDNRKHLIILLTSIYKYILPFIKQQFAVNTTSDSISELAANLCLSAPNSSFGSGNLPKFDDLFKYFIDVNCHRIETTTKFLVIILSSDKINSIEQSVIIRNWIKCSILSTNNYVDLKSLTNIVVTLEEFRVICDVEPSEILNSNEPICSFFDEIGKSYTNSQDFKRRYLLCEKMHSYLMSFDKWITSDSTENLYKIYSMIGIIVLHCSQIVYMRAKSTCFLNVIMNNYILPTSILTEKTPNVSVAQAVHKIWHLLITGIDKLDFKNDSHLLKILTDLIIKWIPHFKFQTSSTYKIIAKPFIYCINECSDNMSNFILDKMSTNFLNLQRRQPNPHANLVLNILLEILNSVCDIDGKLRILLGNVTLSMLEHAMMIDDIMSSRTLIFTFFDNIFKNFTYRSSLELKAIVVNNLKTLTTKHLSYFSAYYFQFMFKLVKLNPSLVQDTIDHLRNEIRTVEHLRGAGRDAKLRNLFDQLEGAIIAAAAVGTSKS